MLEVKIEELNATLSGLLVRIDTLLNNSKGSSHIPGQDLEDVVMGLPILKSNVVRELIEEAKDALPDDVIKSPEVQKSKLTVAEVSDQFMTQIAISPSFGDIVRQGLAKYNVESLVQLEKIGKLDEFYEKIKVCFKNDK